MKIKISNDEADYKRFKALEDEAEQIYKDIVKKTLQVVNVSDINELEIVELLEDTSNYIVNKYRELYLSNRPEHLDFYKIVVSETGVNLHAIDLISNKLKKTISDLGVHAPTINSKGFKRNLKQSSFNVYLDDTKKQHYDSLEQLLNAIKEVEKHTPVNFKLNIVRSIGWQELMIKSDGSLSINTNKFRQ